MNAKCNEDERAIMGIIEKNNNLPINKRKEDPTHYLLQEEEDFRSTYET